MIQPAPEMAIDAISPKIANHALHHFDSTKGHSGGFFSDRLFELMTHADSAKLEKLALAFPAEVAAFRLGKTSGGIHMLIIQASMLRLVVSE
jgi:hypothetical protein